MVARSKFVRAGDWRTLETFWNTTTTAFFRAPAGAEIKVRYGDGSFLGRDSQKQRLDGQSIKRLGVSGASVVVARIQMRTNADVQVTYAVEPGDVAVKPPEIPI